IWTPALQRTPGFIGKEVWVDRLNADRVVVAIWWRTREEWAAFPMDKLAELDAQMGDLTVSLESTEYDVDAASYAVGLQAQGIAGKLAQTAVRGGEAQAEFALRLVDVLRELRLAKESP